MDLFPYPKPIKQKSKQKKRGPTEKQYLENLLDSLVSRYVIARDRGCVTANENCGGNLTCSHYFERAKKHTRYNLINCNCQCSKHNFEHHNARFSNPVRYTNYMLAHYTHEQFSQIAELANEQHFEYTVPELRQMVVEMTIMISETHSLPPLVAEVVQEI